MKKYHGSRKQFSYVENEDFISPLEAVDKVNDDDFIDVINEIVSDRWLQKYNTDWLNKLRKEVDNIKWSNLYRISVLNIPAKRNKLFIVRPCP